MKRYTHRDFITDFSTNAQCLEYIKNARWPQGIHCEKCGAVTAHYLIEKRKCYSCQDCGTQVYPTAGTIFHKSSTPLPVWFYVIFQFAHTRTGISAKTIERETGVTYKTAWRMCQLVRASLEEKLDPFTGEAEMDETYIGGDPRYNILRKAKRGRGTDKVPVFGIVERGGKIMVRVLPNVQQPTILSVVREQVEKGATVYTDEFQVYDKLTRMGYRHDRVKHSRKQYVKRLEDGRKAHTNSLEGFWSYPKTAVKMVHRGVDRRYLQRYLNEHAFRYNHRKDEQPMFFTFLNRAALGEQHDVRIS